MAKKQVLDDELLENSRYEYRVWGKHRAARRLIEDMATAETRDDVEDCYLIVDDPDWNAKVRNSTLKIKYRAKDKRGFEKWSSNWHTDAEGTPAPFDEVFEELSLDRPQRGKKYDITKAVKALDEDSDARAVFVTKKRRRYRIGDIKAEISRIDVHGTDTRLHSIAIQGDNVKALRGLLRDLGLKGEPNVPMHVVIEEQTLDS